MKMDYNTLSAQIQAYAIKDANSLNFITSIPYFIEMGQQRIWRELTGVEFEFTILTEQFKAGSAYLIKPALWNKTISLIYGTTLNFASAANILKARTYEFCRSYWPDANLTDSNYPPEFYSDVFNKPGAIGNNFFISPTPDQDYFYQLTYLRRIDSISDRQLNTTNILTNNYPDLLFYACFLEALAYLRDDERIAVYEQNYQRALESAKAKTIDRHVDRTINRDTD